MSQKDLKKYDYNNNIMLVKTNTDFSKINIIKPFLKWVGGKTQIIEKILGEFPTSMENYQEIFLGGGSVLFGLLCLQQEGKIEIKGKIYAYDFNKSLIYLYKNIQKHIKNL